MNGHNASIRKATAVFPLFSLLFKHHNKGHVRKMTRLPLLRVLKGVSWRRRHFFCVPFLCVCVCLCVCMSVCVCECVCCTRGTGRAAWHHCGECKLYQSDYSSVSSITHVAAQSGGVQDA